MTEIVLAIVIGLVVAVHIGYRRIRRDLTEIQGQVARHRRSIDELKQGFERLPQTSAQGVSAENKTCPAALAGESEVSPDLPKADSAETARGFGVKTEGVTVLAQSDAAQLVEGALEREAFPREVDSTKLPAAAFRGDWEKFTGARLFGWVGGVALFLGLAFLAKYSIDEGWISPAVRVGIGSLAAIASICLGMRLGAKGYAITQHTLCAAGTAVLYTMVYASYDLYGFLGLGLAFPLMILITLGAFLLSIRLESRYMALVGLAGGFLTPILVSSGEDNPVGLFTYVALLDFGLAAVAARMRWTFLFPLSAAATVAVLMAWTAIFFQVDNAMTAVVVWALFPGLFAGFVAYLRRAQEPGESVIQTVGSVSLSASAFAFYLLSYPQLRVRPGLVFGFMLFISLVLCLLSLLDRRFYFWQMAGGALAFLALMSWTFTSLSPELLGWALGFYLVFAVLHCGFPVLVQKIRPASGPLQIWAGVFPLLMIIPFVQIVATGETVSELVWFVLFLINGLALAGTIILGITWLAIAFLVATLGLIWMHLLTIPVGADPSAPLWVLTFFSLAFFALGLYLSGRSKQPAIDGQSFGASHYSWGHRTQLSTFSALLPFLLLATAVIRLPSVDPTQIFGLAALLVLLIFGLVYFWKVDDLSLLALAGVGMLETVWYLARFDPGAPTLTFFWNTGFWLLFLFFPFLFRNAFIDRSLPWWSSALAGPIHFFLIYAAVSQSLGTAYIGLLPAGFVLVYLFALGRLTQTMPPSLPQCAPRVALFAGTTLFFVTLIFPVQLERQWLTIGWALEGVALVWLYWRLPYAQLKKWALALLTIAFTRLALNPEVFFYSPRGEIPILNWYLYGYGIVLICLAAAARIWLPPEERYANLPVRSVLYTMSTVLAFMLLNIEITDYFSVGSELTFQFGKSLAQDLSYSLAWAVFGLSILLTGIRTENKSSRLAGLILIIVTTAKLFLYDLWYLEQLYRVAAFVGLAVILVVVSFLYQRYLSADRSTDSGLQKEA